MTLPCESAMIWNSMWRAGGGGVSWGGLASPKGGGVPGPVAGGRDEFLEVDIAVAEGGFGLAPGCVQQTRKVLRRPHLPHALAPAAGRSFDEQREADARRHVHDFLVGKISFPLGPRYDRHSRP